MIPKVLLYKHKTYSNGDNPVVIQVSHNRKVYREVLFSLNKKDWDEKNGRVKKSHFMHVKYNELILTMLHRVETRSIDARINNVNISKDYLFSAGPSTSLKLHEAISKYIEKLRNEEKFTSAEKCGNLVNKVKTFSEHTLLTEVDANWLDRFNKFLLNFNSHNSAAKNCNTIITVLRYFAKKGQYNDVVAMNHRFRSKPTTKNKLSKEEVIAIANLDLPSGSTIDKTRDAFMLAFYLRGLRISDVLSLQISDIKNDRIIRTARKTNKSINMALVPQAKAIIEKYKGQSKFYVIPLLKIDPSFSDSDRYRKKIESKTTMVNSHLKTIAEMIETDKVLTSHIARHTFAYLADQSGMTAKRIQDMLNHSDLKTTQNYIEDLKKDDVLDKAAGDFIEDLFTE